MRVVIAGIFVKVLLACSQEYKQQELPPLESKVVSSEVMLTDSQIRLANITTQAVRKQGIGQILPVNARLVSNEELTEVISLARRRRGEASALIDTLIAYQWKELLGPFDRDPATITW